MMCKVDPAPLKIYDIDQKEGFSYARENLSDQGVYYE